MKKIRWGIIGLGKIANTFAEDLLLVEDAELFAVASRNKTKASLFAEQYGAKETYDSYNELIENAQVDVIYIATPHAFHFDLALKCIQAKKNVLCEKPMCLNLDETEYLIKEAQQSGCFLMEAIWTQFLPATRELVRLLQEKEIGEVIAMQADFGFKADFDTDGRLFNAALGGGSLMDIGIYPIFLSLLCFGVPSKIKALARKSITDVDASCSMLFDYEKGQKANLLSTFEYQTPCEAELFGTKGSIKLHSRFHQSEKLELLDEHRNQVKVFDLPYKGNGYVHEIEEVNLCLKQGKTQSELLPLAFSSQLAHTINRVKHKIDLNYSQSL